MVRFPKARYAGTTSDIFVQHHDITAAILETANVKAATKIDGTSFLEKALAGKSGPRNHVTVAWGTAVTVITDRWWFNGKVDGSGAFLYDLKNAQPFIRNVADDNTDVVSHLFAQAKEDARKDFPQWLVELARQHADAPGCSELAARA
jgi:arylsulfatase A-like enzyme